jgi:hypothetical protein
MSVRGAQSLGQLWAEAVIRVCFDLCAQPCGVLCHTPRAVAERRMIELDEARREQKLLGQVIPHTDTIALG